MKRMKWIGIGVMLALLNGTSARAQLNVVNPDGLEVPEARAEILFEQTCRTVAEKFHIHHRAQIEFPLTLRIGDHEENLARVDQDTGQYVVHMTSWSEAAFVNRVISLCLFRLLTDSGGVKIIATARGRAEALSGVSVSQLQRKPKGTNGLR